VIDLACGFQPFALPFMGLEHAAYHPFDIDRRLIEAINAFLVRLGRPPTARCKDVLVSVPDVDSDVALMFKAIPTLEQQEHGATVRILRSLRVRATVASFPLASLGGSRKGMRYQYGQQMSQILAELGVPAEPIQFSNEMIYVIHGHGTASYPGEARSAVVTDTD
jgi:hypothetical protein